MTDGRTDRRTDRRTDGGDCNIPNAFLKKRGDNDIIGNSKGTAGVKWESEIYPQIEAFM